MDRDAKRTRGRPPLPPDQRKIVLPDLRCPPDLARDIRESAISTGQNLPAWRLQAYKDRLAADKGNHGRGSPDNLEEDRRAPMPGP